MTKRWISVLIISLLHLARLWAADLSFPTLPLGSSAPDFNLPGVDGRNYALKDFAGAKILVILFTCNHCPTAQYYEDRLKQLVVDYRDKGVAMVAISPNDPKSVRLDELGWTDLSDTFAEMKLRAKDKQFNFPYLYDGDTETVSRAYGPVATPTAGCAMSGPSMIPSAWHRSKCVMCAMPSTRCWPARSLPWPRPRWSAVRSSGPARRNRCRPT
jgi:hypothetical protein